MSQKDTLIRGAYMLVMALILSFLRPIILLLAFGQFVHVLIKKEVHPTLLGFGHSLAQYNYEIVSFLTYNTEEKPFPFSAWPR